MQATVVTFPDNFSLGKGVVREQYLTPVQTAAQVAQIAAAQAQHLPYLRRTG